ncbi:5'-deoxynucleotidase [Vibrio sp. PNB22_3_1]
MFKHKQGSLVGYLLRSRYINRWPLMHSNDQENVAEHCFAVAVIAHRLGLYGLREGRDINPDRLATLAIMHEASEAAGVSDLPGPLKRSNETFYQAIKQIEHDTEESLVRTVGCHLSRRLYKPLIVQSRNEDVISKKFVKAADEIQMLIYCQKQLNSGNGEFKHAHASQLEIVKQYESEMEEVKLFMDNDFPSCVATLDQLQ